MKTELYVVVTRKKYETLGYGSPNKQEDVKVELRKGLRKTTLWSESSAAGFPRYSANNIFNAAKAYAEKVAFMLGCEVEYK